MARFNFEGDTYEEKEGSKCEPCVFHGKGRDRCEAPDEVPDCAPKSRADRRHVYFVLVKGEENAS